MKNMLKQELWKDIPTYEGMYQASSLGMVKSLPRYHQMKTIILKPSICKFGYPFVVLRKNKKGKTLKVHRLVLSAFRGSSNLECNHIDGNKLNNKLDNLEYCTRSENIKHAFRNGLKNAKGEKNKAAKLKNEDVKEIKRLLNNNIPQPVIAEMFLINRRTISAINCGKIWRHI